MATTWRTPPSCENPKTDDVLAPDWLDNDWTRHKLSRMQAKMLQPGYKLNSFNFSRFFSCEYTGGYTGDFHRALATRQFSTESHHHRKQKIARVAAALNPIKPGLRTCSMRHLTIEVNIGRIFTEPRSGEINIMPLFTEMEKTNCFSIYSQSDLNNICRKKPSKVDLIDITIHAWKTCKRRKACAKVFPEASKHGKSK